MAEYTTVLLSKDRVAEGTMAFHFEKPEGFEFRSGQTVDITLVDPAETDDEGNSRTFSIVSAPHENDITIATRMRDTAFKRVLGGYEPGAGVRLDGPFGSFVLHQDVTRPAVFLVGGIGITPFRSMLVDAAARTLPHKIYLFYSNRTPESAPFLAELEGLAKAHESITVVPTMTDPEKSPSGWEGERGYITREMVDTYVPTSAAPIYYMAGPQTMVTAMRTMLTESGVSEDDIKFEEFAGY